MDERSLKNLAHRLRMSLDNAWQAAADFDRARAQYVLGPFLPTGHRIALNEARIFAAEAFHERSTHFNASETITNARRVRRGEFVSPNKAAVRKASPRG